MEPSILEKTYPGIALKIRNGEATLENVFSELNKIAPTDAQFEASFNAFVPSTSNIAKYALMKLNLKVLEDQSTLSDELRQEIAMDKIWWEHIIPQNPGKKAKEYYSGLRVDYEPMIHRLGNQAIILSEWNRKMSNKPFPQKKSFYDLSSLPLTKELSTIADWTDIEVENAQNKQWLIAKEVWDFRLSNM